MTTVPRQIIDKNGKRTTVYVSDEVQRKTIRHKNGTVSSAAVERELIVDGWEVAPEGVTGYGCPFCGVFYTEEQRDAQQASKSMKCFECKEAFTPENANIGVTPDGLRFFDDNVVREEAWYHATVIDDWHNRVITGINEDGRKDPSLSAMVHLGTLQAALDRIKFVSEFQTEGKDQEWVIHKIQLDPKIPIHATVIEDDNAEPNLVYLAQEDDWYEGGGATRYVNRYENEGSVSLTVNPNKLTVVESFSRGKDGLFAGLND